MTKRSKQSYQEAGRRGGLSRSPRKLAASSANLGLARQRVIDIFKFAKQALAPTPSVAETKAVYAARRHVRYPVMKERCYTNAPITEHKTKRRKS